MTIGGDPVVQARAEIDAAVGRASMRLDEALGWVAAWCPHGMDSSRSSDYREADLLRSRIERAKACLSGEYDDSIITGFGETAEAVLVGTRDEFEEFDEAYNEATVENTGTAWAKATAAGVRMLVLGEMMRSSRRCVCPSGMRYHSLGCPVAPGEPQTEEALCEMTTLPHRAHRWMNGVSYVWCPGIER